MNSKPQKRKFDKLAFMKKDALAKRPKQVIHVASTKLQDLQEKLVVFPMWDTIDHEVAEYKIIKQRGHPVWNPKCVVRGSSGQGKTVWFTTPPLVVIAEETGPHGNMGKYESTKTLNKAKKTISVAPNDPEGELFMQWVNDVEREHCEAACNMETEKGNVAWAQAVDARDSEEEVWEEQNKLLKDVVVKKKRKKMFETRKPATKWAKEGEEPVQLPILYWLYDEDTKTWEHTETIERLVPGAVVQLRCSFRAYCIHGNMYGVSCDFDRDVLVHSMPKTTSSMIPIIDLA